MHADFDDAQKAILRPRFEALMSRDADGHWRWTGFSRPKGYGVFNVARGRTIQAHRAAWILFRGPIEGGRQLHHICGLRSCVNPDHLEVVSPAEHQDIHRERERITVCVNGHPFEGENIGWRIHSDGYRERYCRECGRANTRRHYWLNADRLRAAARARYKPR